MSYVRKNKIFKLVFEDPEMEGLVVRARSVPLGELLKIVRMTSLDTEDMKAEDLAVLDDVFRIFAGSLVSWNLEQEIDGVNSPVPLSLEGIYSQDLDFMISIVGAWVEAIAGVSRPLAKRSPGGGTFPEGSLPMESLSPSRVS